MKIKRRKKAYWCCYSASEKCSVPSRLFFDIPSPILDCRFALCTENEHTLFANIKRNIFSLFINQEQRKKLCLSSACLFLLFAGCFSSSFFLLSHQFVQKFMFCFYCVCILHSTNGVYRVHNTGIKKWRFHLTIYLQYSIKRMGEREREKGKIALTFALEFFGVDFGTRWKGHKPLRIKIHSAHKKMCFFSLVPFLANKRLDEIWTKFCFCSWSVIELHFVLFGNIWLHDKQRKWSQVDMRSTLIN